MQVHLVDGTYELFRHHYGLPPKARESRTAASRGVLGTVVAMLADGFTHIGVATDHVIESFRNRLWPTYKSSAGVPDALLDQFPLVEEALGALGVVVWPMVDVEADDALASAAAVCLDDPAVDQAVIWTPDKDLGQCVRGRRVVQADRRKKAVIDEEAVVARYGIPPTSLPDYQALVGDSADGYPGLPQWGPKAAAAVLVRYPHLEDIPPDPRGWDVPVRGVATLASTLRERWDDALLFRELATLRVDRSLLKDGAALEWPGPGPELEEVCRRLKAPGVYEKAMALRS